MEPIEDQALTRGRCIEQLQKIEDDTDITSASNFFIAQNWEGWNTKLGLFIVGLSGIVTVISAILALEELKEYRVYLTVISTIFASAATAIGSVLTFLKPSERASRYRDFGNKQKDLRNRIRIYRSIESSQALDLNSIIHTLKDFSEEKNALNSDNPPIDRSAFVVASQDIAEKRQRRAKMEAAPK
jgi:hypothetical protein